MTDARDPSRSYGPLRLSLFLSLFLMLCGGCVTPVGVTRVSPEAAYHASTANPISEGELSNSARAVLHRYYLAESFALDPVGAIRTLQETAILDDRRDLVFALAEMSYLLGVRLRSSSSWADLDRAPDAFLLSAVYAYFYLLGEGKEPPPTAYDNRFREACDLYNRALARAFPLDDGGIMTVAGGERTLPLGTLTLTVKTGRLSWRLDEFDKFLPADAFAVHGFSVRNRTPGLGLPLIGVTKEATDSPNGGALPVTAFLRIEGGIKEFGSGRDSATLELYSAYDDTEVKVNGRSVPLETDSTAPLAYRLNDPELWSFGLKKFFSGGRIDSPLLLIQPYERGKIPVVFVHGTASSPVWWAEMLNTLRADPAIRKRFQFWFYQYNSSKLILMSGATLRETLTDMVQRLDPQGKDPALRQMVVVGHSQGGLLTKLSVVAPGERLWTNISDTALDDFDVDDEIKEMARRMFFFQPLPFVTRVVFISTPHRGSFLAKEWVRKLLKRVMTIPLDVLTLNPELYSGLVDQFRVPATMRQMTTSIDSMSAENPNLQLLATLPLAPGVTGHSIIAVLPGMAVESGNDGVVAYRSAHLDGMASEFIVRADHSCQGHPFTIEAVRRILHEHIGNEVVGPEDILALRSPEGGGGTAVPAAAPSPLPAVPAAGSGQ